MADLIKNKEWVEANRQDLLKAYKNKFVVIANEKVISSFDHYDAAANFGIDNFGTEGGFLIEYLTEEEPVNFVMSADI